MLATENEYIMNEIIQQLTSEYSIPLKYINTDYSFSKQRIMSRINTLKNVSEIIYENNVLGVTAELGVFQGQFARHINAFFPERKLYLFDTFESFNSQDIEKNLLMGTNNETIKQFNFSNTEEEFVLSKMKYRENCIIKKDISLKHQ